MAVCRSLVLLTLFGAVLATFALGDPAQERDALQQRYEHHMARGHYGDALQVAQALLRSDKKSPEFKLMAAAAELRGGRFDLALKKLRRLKKDHPDLPGLAAELGYHQMSLAKTAQGHLQSDEACRYYQRAIDYFGQALAENPADLEARVGRSAAFMGIEEYPRAIDGYFEWLEAEPSSLLAKQTLIELLVESGWIVEAELEFEQLSAPDRPIAAFNIGRGWVEAGRLDKARRYQGIIAAIDESSWEHAALEALICLRAPDCDSTSRFEEYLTHDVPDWYDRKVFDLLVMETDSELPVPGGDISEPVLVKTVPPEYPFEARSARVRGKVVMRAIIDQEGAVRRVRIASATQPFRGAFVRAAIDAVRQWRYEPARQHGKPVTVMFTVVMNFDLD